MVGSDNKRHGLVGIVGSCQFETFGNDCLGMIALVATIEGIVLRQDGLLDIDVYK